MIFWGEHCHVFFHIILDPLSPGDGRYKSLAELWKSETKVLGNCNMGTLW